MSMSPREQFGTFDFGLTSAQEERAARLHQESIIIDMLFQGPCGWRVFDDEMTAELAQEFSRTGDPGVGLWSSVKLPIRRAIQGRLPQFEEHWRASGVTAGNRQTIGMTVDESLEWFALAQAQFDRFTWLDKAIVASDIREAKQAGRHAGFISTQDTVDIGLDLNRLNRYYDLGMRMIQLTYNSANFVASGCTDRADGGVTDYGVKFIKRMNGLGMVVDTGHCGRQSTLDACAISTTLVVASHTAAQTVYAHDRGKSDQELQAIAATGGVIGVLAIPQFLTAKPEASISDMLDHIDYITSLVGWQHTGIGTDWPMQVPKLALQQLSDYALSQGNFRPEHRVDESLKNLVGFDDYRDFPNITRGLVGRGYTDEQIRGILGENFLRVFEQVCG